MTEGPKSNYLKVTCNGCKSEQLVFGKTASKVKCNSCGMIIAKPSGGKTIVIARVKEVL